MVLEQKTCKNYLCSDFNLEKQSCHTFANDILKHLSYHTICELGAIMVSLVATENNLITLVSSRSVFLNWPQSGIWGESFDSIVRANISITIGKIIYGT